MLGLPGLLLLGIGAQWLAWRLKLPSILLLLLAGFVVGPFTGNALLDPDELLGEELHHIVSLAVAVILFEGGLTLHLRELRGSGWAVTSLILIGPVITMSVVTVLARWTLGFEWESSMLLGAILVVTGPTVIGPLLRHVRPSGVVGKVVRWEGIVTDPIGAIVAVLVFQAFLHGEAERGLATRGLARAIGAGGGFGLVGGLVTVFLLKRRLVPDFLHAPVTMALAVLAYVGANNVQGEAGLLAVTLMGMLLANQSRVVVDHILEFKENLRVILIGLLFILLAARLPMKEFQEIDLRSVTFLALLIFVSRPLTVFLSTIGTGLTWREKVFVSWMAPRGIVAAAVASLFALDLDPARFPLAAARLVPVVFLVIIGTVLVYGLTAAPLARRLGLAKQLTQGVLFVGAHAWARELARALVVSDIDVILADTNHKNVQTARIEGLNAHYGNVLTEDFEHDVPIESLGFMVAVTHSDEVNALACIKFGSLLGRNHVFQLTTDQAQSGSDALPAHMRGAALFSGEADYFYIERRLREGAIVKRTRLSEEFGYQDFRALYEQPEAPVLPLFLIDAQGRLTICSPQEKLDPQPGDLLIALVDPGEEE